MRADIFLEVVDHLFSMLKVLDREEHGHGEGKQGDKSYDDLESEAFIKFNLSHFFFKIGLFPKADGPARGPRETDEF